MPYFRLETNVPKSKVTPDVLKKIAAAVAKTLGKPVCSCDCCARSTYAIWGDDNRPCGTATLMSIGSLGVEQNKKHSAVLFPLLKKELGIPEDRLYITFSDQSSSNVGYTGTTFQKMLG